MDQQFIQHFIREIHCVPAAFIDSVDEQSSMKIRKKTLYETNPFSVLQAEFHNFPQT